MVASTQNPHLEYWNSNPFNGVIDHITEVNSFETINLVLQAIAAKKIALSDKYQNQYAPSTTLVINQHGGFKLNQVGLSGVEILKDSEIFTYISYVRIRKNIDGEQVLNLNWIALLKNICSDTVHDILDKHGAIKSVTQTALLQDTICLTDKTSVHCIIQLPQDLYKFYANALESNTMKKTQRMREFIGSGGRIAELPFTSTELIQDMHRVLDQSAQNIDKEILENFFR